MSELNNKEDIFKQNLNKFIDKFDYNVTEWSIAHLNNIDDKNKYKYSFTIYNGAFRNETLTFSFSYFVELNENQIVKFIMRSLSDHNSNYIWDFKKDKFVKVMVIY